MSVAAIAWIAMLLGIHQAGSFVTHPRRIFIPKRTSLPLSSSSILLKDNSIEDNDIGRPVSESERLWAYATNLQRVRRENSTLTEQMKPVTSLSYFLSQNIVSEVDDISEPLSRALVQGIRISAASGNYKLIIRLMEGVAHFAGDSQVVEPRIVGEAVRGLHVSKASLSKIRTVWSEFYDGQTLVRPIECMEVNTMLEILGSKGKVRALVELYHNATTTDGYSISIALSALKASISQGQSTSTPGSLPLELARFTSLCWQWNEAITIFFDGMTNKNVNTIVVANLLQINKRSNQMIPAHPGVGMASQIWAATKENGVKLDNFTSAMLINSLGRREDIVWDIFHTVKKYDSVGSEVYAAMIACCIRSRKLKDATVLLGEARQAEWGGETDVLKILIRALSGNLGKVTLSRKMTYGDRATAKVLLGEMLSLVDAVKCTSALDTEVYNYSILCIELYGRLLKPVDWDELASTYPHYFGQVDCQRDSPDELVTALLGEMKAGGVVRDSATHSLAIRAVSIRDPKKVLLLLADCTNDVSVSGETDGLLPVYNSALLALGNAGYLKQAIQVYTDMRNTGISCDYLTSEALISALAHGGQSSFIPIMFESKQHEIELPGKLGLIRTRDLPLDHLSLLPRTISLCLLVGDYRSAKETLELMRRSGTTPSEETIHEITRAYARSAILRGGRFSTDSQTKATSAFKLLSRSEKPSTGLLCLVAKACAYTGLFDMSSATLRRVHRKVMAENTLNHAHHSQPNVKEIEARLSSTHRYILSSCAVAGNSTAALGFVNMIQEARQMLYKDEVPGYTSMWTSREMKNVVEQDEVGMKAREWVSLVIAASKAGHWRLCVGSLQFLQFYLESIHPTLASRPMDSVQFDKDYQSIAPALTWAARCLSAKTQYGWVIRLLEDWMQWSGRRPPVEAVAAATRVLSRRGQGDEANLLLSKCVSCAQSPNLNEGADYEVAIFVRTITTLHGEGLYKEADETFVSALNKGILPLNLQNEVIENTAHVTLDLHGMSLAVAHSAVRVALQQEILASTWGANKSRRNDLIIITGRGRRSTMRMRPVLRPEVQRMLVEEFYPPLATVSIPGNMGALRIPAENIEAWLDHQREQTGVRMQAVASALKRLSSGDTLRKALVKKAKDEQG